MRKLLFIVSALLLCPSFLAAQTDAVVFSHLGGFYENSFSLELSCSEAYHIRYTTNGATPTTSSKLYEEPLWLDERLYSRSDIYKVQISPDDLVYVPDSVRHAIVIRAAAFDGNEQCVGATVTHTYLIRELGCDAAGLPVMSVCADSLDLFDYEKGIFVPGANYDPASPDHSGNYYQSGKEWERTVNVEFFEPDDNSGINQVCGLRTHGNRSRRYPSKGMKIYAREDYGMRRFDHAFFGDSQLTSFKHLILKPFASFWPYSGAQDYVCNALARQLNVESPLCRPMVVYINGEYWGLYFIQEKTDERFLEDHYGVDPDACNIIGDWKGEVEQGSDRNFKRMMRWLEDADLSKADDYEKVCEMIDIDNYIDYMVFETFVGNWDWPGNNMRCWQVDDGPWRWMFFDGDATIINPDMDVFLNAAVYYEPATWENYPETKLLFSKLLENNQFKSAFKARAHELCGDLFQYENTSAIFNEVLEALRPKISDQKHRFGYPPSMGVWNDGNALIDAFLRDRVARYLDDMESFPLLKEDVTLANLDQFVCYPNPSEGEFRLKMLMDWPRPYNVYIYNVLGQLVYCQSGSVVPDETIPIEADLAAGVYFVRIGSCVQKMIKM